MEYSYSLKLSNKADLIQEDVEAVNRLCQVPVNWTIENDEALVKLLCDQMPPDNEQLGSIKNYVDSIDVSSFVSLWGQFASSHIFYFVTMLNDINSHI